MRRSPRFLTAAIFGVASIAATSLAATAAHATDASLSGGVVSSPALPSAAAPLTRTASEAAVQHLQDSATGVRAIWRLGQTGPSVVTGLKVATVGDTVTARALQFAAANEALIGVRATELKAGEVRSLKNRDVVVFEQQHAGKRVWQRSVAITVDNAGSVISVSNDTRAIDAVDAATITIEQARTIALGSGNAGAKKAEAVVVVGTAGAFDAAVFFTAPVGTLEVEEVVVNLHDGTIASTQSAIRR